jgi:hypothetical protein
MYAIQTFCEYIKYVPGRELAQNLFVDPATCCIFFRQMHEARIRRCFRSICQSLEKGGDIVVRLRVRYTMVFQLSVDCIEIFEIGGKCRGNDAQRVELTRILDLDHLS